MNSYLFEYKYFTYSCNIPHYRNLFNGQEADNEVYGDGAVLGYEFRQYDARTGRWWSVDPLVDKYPGVSPYAFCIGNPILLMDPSGREIGDYFDENGTFLMNDGIDDGRIYIVNSEQWNCIWDDNEGLPHTIRDNPSLLQLFSSAKPPSSVNLSDGAIYNILNYYNTTGLPLNQTDLGESQLLQTTTKQEVSQKSMSFTHVLKYDTQQWRNNQYFLNNSYDIKSSFDNEIGHIKAVSPTYITLSEGQREVIAIFYQQSQKNYKKTSGLFKEQMNHYLQQSMEDDK